MRDQYDREINYMRISVTDRCNLRCTFCMPEGETAHFAQDELLTGAEIVRIVQAAVSLGIHKFRLTGGEPLMRSDITELTAQIAAVRGVKKVVMTTNGVLLEEKLEELVRAGLSGVNVSLCAADEKTYRSVTGSSAFERVQRGICAAVDAGLAVRINCVPMAGRNADQTLRIAAYAKERAVDVCFIELMPIGRGGEFSYPTGDTVLAALREHYGPVCEELQTSGDAGPAVYYRFPGFLGRIGLIRARSRKFCGQCNRVRLTADGRLKLCLAYADGVNLRDVLRSGDGAQLGAVMREAVYQKPREHDFDADEKRVDSGGTREKVQNFDADEKCVDSGDTRGKVQKTACVQEKAAAGGMVRRREEHYMPQIGG